MTLERLISFTAVDHH